MKNSNSGSALMEVVLAAGMVAIISYTSMSLLTNNNKALKTAQTKIESQDLTTEVSSILASTKNCSESFKDQKLDVDILNPLTKSKMWESSSDFVIKQENESPDTFEDRFGVDQDFGVGKAIKIKSYSITEDETHSFNSANKSQFLMLTINFERKESSYVRNYQKKFPVWLKIDASNNITDCRSLQSEDQIWKRSKVEASNIFYDQLAGNDPGLVTIGASTENRVVKSDSDDDAKAVHMSKKGITVTTTGLTPNDFPIDVSTWPAHANKGALIAPHLIGVGEMTVTEDSTVKGTYTVLEKDKISSVDQENHGFNLTAKALTMSNTHIGSMQACAEKLIDGMETEETKTTCTNTAGATYAVNGFAFGQESNGTYMAGNPSVLVGSNNGKSFHLTANALLLSPTNTGADLKKVASCADFLGADGNPQAGDCSGAEGGIYSAKSFALGSASTGYIAGNPSGISGRNKDGGHFSLSANALLLSPDSGGMEAVASCSKKLSDPNSTESCVGAKGAFFTPGAFALGSETAQKYIGGSPAGLSGSDGIGTFWMSADRIELSPNGGDATINGGFKVSSELFYIGTSVGNFRGDATGIYIEGTDPAKQGKITFQTNDGYGQNITASNKLHLNGNQEVKIDAARKIEINGGPEIVLNATTVKTKNDLHVAGIINAKKFTTIGVLSASNGQFKSLVSQNIAMNSDRRLKTEIKPVLNSLEKILKLNGVTYYWKNSKPDARQQIGLIAQDVEAQFPQAVNHNEDGFLSVNYMGLIGAVVESLKEIYQKLIGLNSKINDLQQQQQHFEEKINQQKALIEKQEKMINTLIQQIQKK
jgi:hypothetical protein